MKIKPLGDYYVWYCDWCDSRNSILWTRIDSPSISCSACQQKFCIRPDGELVPTGNHTLREAV
jgi:hypothetical protein